MQAMEDVYVEVFGKRFGDQSILSDISLILPEGSFTVITGPSGCGKTTLLRIIAGLDKRFDGFTGNLPLNIGFAFQEPRLIPWRTLSQNLKLVCPHPGRVERLLSDMGLSQAAGLYPGEVSLGMARRAALARAFAIEADLLLLDEPMTSLDQANAENLRQQLLSLWQQHRPRVLMVTHDLREALQLADRIIVLDGNPSHIRMELEYRLPQQQRNAEWIARELENLEQITA
jgi:NitT/TauT family transport system ATP-binding protein